MAAARLERGNHPRQLGHRAHLREIRRRHGVGAIYAQAEDDFNRIERNYLSGLGWLAQADGESAVYGDLRVRLFVDPARLAQQFAQSPDWLKELMTSDEGLNVYGAATWGQFFIYQGFNAHNGWMHTSYGGDAIDEYAESMVKKFDGRYYRYGASLKKLRAAQISVPYKQNNLMKVRKFRVYFSHHGPIVRADRGKWIAVKLLQEPVQALAQSYLRTKTADYPSFRRTQAMRTDTSNNTVYADVDGTIAYFHGNFIPKRDPRFDFTQPVDGSNPATEWQGPHALEDTITLLNPSNGWIQNTNDWPFSAAGADSPRRENYPGLYVDQG